MHYKYKLHSVHGNLININNMLIIGIENYNLIINNESFTN